MNITWKSLTASFVLGVALTLGVLGMSGVFSHKTTDGLGAVTPLEELRNPNLARNNGYYSALPIILQGANGDITVGDDLTVSGDFALTGPASVTTFTQGGGITSTSTSAATATMLASEFDTENVYNMTPGGAALTLTSPASSTLSSFIPIAGQTRDVLLRNRSSVTSTTFAIGAGLNLHNSTGTTAVLTPNASAILRFVREGTSATISVFMLPLQDL